MTAICGVAQLGHYVKARIFLSNAGALIEPHASFSVLSSVLSTFELSGRTKELSKLTEGTV